MRNCLLNAVSTSFSAGPVLKDPEDSPDVHDAGTLVEQSLVIAIRSTTARLFCSCPVDITRSPLIYGCNSRMFLGSSMLGWSMERCTLWSHGRGGAPACGIWPWSARPAFSQALWAGFSAYDRFQPLPGPAATRIWESTLKPRDESKAVDPDRVGHRSNVASRNWCGNDPSCCKQCQKHLADERLAGRVPLSPFLLRMQRM